MLARLSQSCQVPNMYILIKKICPVGSLRALNVNKRVLNVHVGRIVEAVKLLAAANQGSLVTSTVGQVPARTEEAQPWVQSTGQNCWHREYCLPTPSIAYIGDIIPNKELI